MKIVADRSACIGSGMCVLTAPAVFDQDDAEGLVVLLVAEPEGADARAAAEAVRLCPAGALAGSGDQPGE
jgi:ferredoxin